MLYVDKRVGSGELAKYLAMIHLPIEVTSLAFGDMYFLGRGEEDCPVPVGIERKALADFITSMRSGRLQSHQLPGLLNTYQDIWIVIEGPWRIDPQNGLILVPKGKGWTPMEPSGKGIDTKGITYRELMGMFLTLEIKGGVRIRQTWSKTETGRFLSTLYHWWTDKSFEQHRSHLQFRTQDADKALLVQPSLCREWAARLPGVAWVKSGSVDQHFDSAWDMATSDEAQWAEIDGIGKPMAKKIVAAIRKKKGSV